MHFFWSVVQFTHFKFIFKLVLKKKKNHIQTFTVSSRFSLVLMCCHIVKRCGITGTHLWCPLCLEFGSDSEVMRNATNTKWCMRDKFSQWLNCQFLCRQEATTPSERRQKLNQKFSMKIPKSFYASSILNFLPTFFNSYLYYIKCEKQTKKNREA